MEQARGEDQAQQQEQPSTPLKCPRCNSLDTKFRYFNNHSLAQPRYYCKTCKRQWTVGGHLRNIPFGGKSRYGKQTKASSSRYGNQRSQSSQPPLPLGEGHRPASQSLTPMAATIPHNFDTTISPPVTDLPTAGSPFSLYCFNDEISCLDAIQSLIYPEVINQHVNAGNQFGSGSAKNAPPSHFNNNLVQPTWPINYSPQDATNNLSFSTSDACLWSNFSDNTTDTEMDTTSVNVDEWLNFPGCSPP